MLQAKKSFWGTRPGFDIGDVLHIGVNVLFVVVLFAMVELWELAPLAGLLVILSKWRILAVQPRFWLPNIKANLVDIIVGISTVILANQAVSGWLSIMWLGLYLLWLLFLKPQTQDIWVGFQALWAQLIGMITLFMVPSVVRQPLLACLLAWVIAWASARHFFGNYEEPHYRTLGLIWGLLAAQLTWVGLHWIQYYIVFELKIALPAVMITIVSASLGSVYHAYKTDNLHRGIFVENMLFAVALLIVILSTAHWTAQL